MQPTLPDEMRLLTLTQPWASLVGPEADAKHIETRGWATPYRGWIAIHAAASLKPVGGLYGLQKFVLTSAFMQSAIAKKWEGHAYCYPQLYLPFGKIVAVARLVDCRPIAVGIREWGVHLDEGDYIWPLTPAERAFGDYTPGRWAWLLHDIRRLRRPVEYRGAQGLRRLPAEAIRAVWKEFVGADQHLEAEGESDEFYCAEGDARRHGALLRRHCGCACSSACARSGER